MRLILFIIGIIFLVLGIITVVASGLSAFFLYVPLIVIGLLLITIGRRR